MILRNPVATPDGYLNWMRREVTWRPSAFERLDLLDFKLEGPLRLGGNLLALC